VTLKRAWIECCACGTMQRGGVWGGVGFTHFIGQDAVESAGVDGHKPVQPDVLILPHRVFQQERGLHTVEGLRWQASIL